MSMLVGLLAKQIMRQAELSPEAGKRKYQQLLVETDEYAGVKAEVDNLLLKCGFELF